MTTVGLLACSLWFSGCANDGDPAAQPVTVPVSTIDAKDSTSTSPTASSTTTTVAPAPTTARTRPTTSQTPAPSLGSVRVASPAPGATCVLGTSTTAVLLWDADHAAGVRIFSTSYGDLGQFPAEDGAAEVPFDCDGGSTIFSLTPVAEGGATGDRVDLEVPSYMT